jgi:hypothetical protein
MPNDFKVMTAEHLRKWNAQRRALSQPDVYLVPALKPSQVLFVPAAKMGGEPATCYNCQLYNYGKSCMLMGKNILIYKFIYPPKATADAKRIEYWPCCGMWDRGQPNFGAPKFMENLSTPDELGLIWINAPEPGLEISGATCGGMAGDKPIADECDHYISKEADARDAPTAFCRVLQQDVENGAVCAAWIDDDRLEYFQAVSLMRELENGD